MCIRDRSMLESRVVPRDREQYREHLDTERILALLQHGQAYTFAYSMAVSYTHLDVYKRQFSSWPPVTMLKPMGKPAKNLALLAFLR